MLIALYIFREWLKGFLLAGGLILGILVLSVLYDDFPDLLGYGASASEMATYFFLLGPGFLPGILPLTLLISILFIFSGLHRHNEITALRAAGFSLYRISFPIWIAGTALSLLLLWLNADLVPRSMDAAEAYRETLRDRSLRQSPTAVVDIHELGFFQSSVTLEDGDKGSRMWFFDRFDPRSGEASGLHLYERTQTGEDWRRTRGESAEWLPETQQWRLGQGQRVLYDPTTGEPEQVLRFESTVLEAGQATPEIMLALRQRPKNLSLFAVRKILQTLPRGHPEAAPYEVRYHSLLASPLTCLMIVGLAIPFAVAGVRTHPFVGISKSVGLFFFFFLLASISTLLGERQILAPVIAAWLPLVAGTLTGLGLLYRHR